jgi:hypothetical protein
VEQTKEFVQGLTALNRNFQIYIVLGKAEFGGILMLTL